MPRPGRLALLGVALAATLGVSACGGAHPAATGTTSTTRPQTTTTTTSSVATTTPTGTPGQWSKAIRLAPGEVLSVVSCPAAGSCLAASATGLSYALIDGQARTIGPIGSSPSPQGDAYLTCTSTTFCAAVPNLNQVFIFDGFSWSAPTTIPGAQGFTAIGCVGRTFCTAIDGEGNAFDYDGQSWSGNVGAWGAANQISCVTASFCVAAEGGPSVFNGRAWTQPNDVDPSGQH